MIIYLIFLNLVGFGLTGYDKAIAGTNRRRIPERTFFIVAAAGGSAGVLVGMGIFRHKTRKGSFQVKILTAIFLQILLLRPYFLGR